MANTHVFYEEYDTLKNVFWLDGKPFSSFSSAVCYLMACGFERGDSELYLYRLMCQALAREGIVSLPLTRAPSGSGDSGDHTGENL